MERARSRGAHRHTRVLAGGPLRSGHTARCGNRGPGGMAAAARNVCRHVELRKGDHTAERIQIERERLELEKDKTEKRIDENLEELLKQPQTKLSTEERARRIR